MSHWLGKNKKMTPQSNFKLKFPLNLVRNFLLGSGEIRKILAVSGNHLSEKWPL